MTGPDTPRLLLDRARLERNAARLRERCAALGVGFRPHFKTAKSAEVALLSHGGAPGPATVSTMREAEALAALLDAAAAEHEVLVEVDCGEHRAGVPPERAVAVARAVHASRHLRLSGVMTHGGHSYGTADPARVAAIAEAERAAAVAAAEAIRAAGLPAPVVPVGSTPWTSGSRWCRCSRSGSPSPTTAAPTPSPCGKA